MCLMGYFVVVNLIFRVFLMFFFSSSPKPRTNILTYCANGFTRFTSRGWIEFLDFIYI